MFSSSFVGNRVLFRAWYRTLSYLLMAVVFATFFFFTFRLVLSLANEWVRERVTVNQLVLIIKLLLFRSYGYSSFHLLKPNEAEKHENGCILDFFFISRTDALSPFPLLICFTCFYTRNCDAIKKSNRRIHSRSRYWLLLYDIQRMYVCFSVHHRHSNDVRGNLPWSIFNLFRKKKKKEKRSNSQMKKREE